MHTAKPLVLKPSSFEAEIAVENLVWVKFWQNWFKQEVIYY